MFRTRDYMFLFINIHDRYQKRKNDQYVKPNILNRKKSYTYSKCLKSGKMKIKKGKDNKSEKNTGIVRRLLFDQRDRSCLIEPLTDRK